MTTTFYVKDGDLITKAGFNPAQPRNALGQWSAAQSQAATTAGAKTKVGGTDPNSPAAIKKIQAALGIPQTGKIDLTYRSAVRKFQTRYHLQVDGIVGRQTTAALNAGMGAGKAPVKGSSKAGTRTKAKTKAKVATAVARVAPKKPPLTPAQRAAAKKTAAAKRATAKQKAAARKKVAAQRAATKAQKQKPFTQALANFNAQLAAAQKRATVVKSECTCRKYFISDGLVLKGAVCTGPGPCDTKPFSTSRTSNWVARAGGLPPYVRAIAHALMRKGMDESKAIAIAVSRVKSGFGPKSTAETKGHSAEAAADWEAKKAKAHVGKNFIISKVDEDQHTVFGWAYITHDEAGRLNVDKSGEYIDDPEELAAAAYDFMLESRSGGREHSRSDTGPVVHSTMIESVMFTPEKLEKMGVPEGTLPAGWWVGFKVHDEDTWQGVKDGRWKSFSIHGTGSKMAT